MPLGPLDLPASEGQGEMIDALRDDADVEILGVTKSTMNFDRRKLSGRMPWKISKRDC